MTLGYWATLGLVATQAACEARLFVAMPEGAAWVTVVQEKDGQIPEARLLPTTGSRLELPASSSGELTVVGFEQSSLAPLLARVSEAEVAAATVRGLSRCDAPLPAPLWARALVEPDRFEDVPPESLPPLTSSLFDGRSCDSTTLAWEVVCGTEGTACAMRIDQVQGCSYTMGSCPLLGLSGVGLELRGDDRVCVPGPPPSCQHDAEAGPHGVMTCRTAAVGDCELRAFVAAEPRLRMSRRIQVRDVPPRAPTLLQNLAQGERYRLMSGQGYVTAFAVLDDRVVVVVPPDYLETATCEDGRASALHFYAKKTLEPLPIQQSDSCISAVEAAAEGRLFLATFLDRARPGQAGVILFDREGVELSRSSVPISLREGSVMGLTLGADGRDGFIVVARESRATNGEGGRTHLFRASLDGDQALRLGAVQLVSHPDAQRSVELRAPVRHRDLLAFPDPANPTGILWLDPNTLELQHQLFVDGALNLSRRPYVLYAPPVGESLLVATLGNSPRVLVVEDFEIERNALMFEAELAQPTGFARWGEDPRYALVTLFYEDPHAVLFDTQGKHYLPGRLELGFGFPSSVRADGDTAWVLLPWEGSLVEVSPALPQPVGDGS